MDWNGLIETAHGAPALAWVAAGAIAAGATLLVTASVLQLKRRAARRRLRKASQPAIVPTSTGYAPAATPLVASAPAPLRQAPAPVLEALTARLAAAADRLAEIEAELDARNEVSDRSFLKESPSDVEYVFRSGTA